MVVACHCSLVRLLPKTLLCLQEMKATSGWGKLPPPEGEPAPPPWMPIQVPFWGVIVGHEMCGNSFRVHCVRFSIKSVGSPIGAVLP